MRIKKIVSTLIKKHGTNDPYEIASQKNILVLPEPLGETLGYFNTYKRIKIIHINAGLDETIQKFVCSHELGHGILHPKENTPFLKKNTFFSTDKIEREANTFAVELLMPDEVIYEQYGDTTLTIKEVAATYGVPHEVADFKKLER
jgi:Zn-dependent peptidase ImmA (M78 family)